MAGTADRPEGPREYWEGRLGQRYALEGVGVTALGPGFNRWAYRVRRARFRAAVGPLITGLDQGPRVIDVGSGTGFYLQQWRALGATDLTAADLTEVAVAGLREADPGITVVRIDIGAAGALAKAGVEPGSFDCASAMDIMFHILDGVSYRRAFANLAALLRPGGYLILTEDMAPGRRPRRRRIKVTRPARRTRRAWRAGGLEQVSVEPLFVLMNFPSAGGRRARRRWALLQRLLAGRPWLGGPVGALLYPLERVLLRLRSDGPSTKLVVLRKPVGEVRR